MSALAIAILLLSTATYSTERDDVFTTTAACSIEPDGLFPADPVDATGPARAVDPPPRSLFLSAESRVLREDPSELSASVLVRVDRQTPFSPRRRFRLESPGRAWPFALAATADAATTYWALAHGGRERNPLLAFGRVDVGMLKIIQFPLLAKAIDVIEARHPRLGRRLRWATLVFHAVLAVNNVRMGRSAGERGLDAHPRARP
ncbi:MAG TPA: hypothetical protein VIK51_25235 [Vicinamibacteria bacterium]|jgi:hypothetical protein